jgi:hypothetical protein
MLSRITFSMLGLFVRLTINITQYDDIMLSVVMLVLHFYLLICENVIAVCVIVLNVVAPS